MRSRIFLLVLAMFSIIITCQGQSLNSTLLSNAASGTKPLDTVANTATVTMSSGIVKGTPALTTVLVLYSKLTGTVAGTATLLGSLNGNDWVKADSTTYTITDVSSQGTSWKLTGSPYLYYRVETVGSGTSTYTVKGSVFTRNP